MQLSKMSIRNKISFKNSMLLKLYKEAILLNNAWVKGEIIMGILEYYIVNDNEPVTY